MDVDEESSVDREVRLTLTDVKAWSFGKLEGLTGPSFLRGLIKPSLSQLASRVYMEPQHVFDKFPFSRQTEVALLSQNGVLYGLGEDISCRDKPLKAIDADETIFKNGLRPHASYQGVECGQVLPAP